jgi:CBS domain-containing protein
MRHTPGDPGQYPGHETAAPLYVRDRMSRPAITISARASIDDGLRLMARYRIHYLPVVGDDACLVGFVNADDLRGHERAGAPTGETIGSIMRSPVVSVTIDTTIGDAVRLMVSRGVGALPVIADGHVVGILTQSDAVETLSRDRG